jgi:hypothetical protein
MNPPHFILIAYARNGLRQAVNVAEILRPFAEVRLCSYDLSSEQFLQEPDAVLCVVTDEESVEMAHDFQGRLQNVPTVVVDNSGGLSIELNGYAGRVSSSPDQVLDAVRELLANSETTNCGNLRVTPSEPKRNARRVATPFNHVLVRTAGGSQKPQAILIAAARQLSSDLRAEGTEVYQHIAETNAFEKIYAEPERVNNKDSDPSAEVIRLIKRRLYPTTPDDLESRSLRPLHCYLARKRLNLLVPLAKDARLLGWIAFFVPALQCTDDLLDDIHVAAHLLSTSLTEALRREEQNRDADHLQSALSALSSGIVVVNQAGQILCIAGAVGLLGSCPQKGNCFKTIHNSRVREVIALALRGNFVEKSWIDFDTQATISSFSARLPEGKIVAFWAPRKTLRDAREESGLELREVLDSLPVPVLFDNEVSPGTVPVPQGRISDEDGRAIVNCALRARARNVKALRLRWGEKQSPENAVLFYDAAVDEGRDEFADDIKHAVRFSLLAA